MVQSSPWAPVTRGAPAGQGFEDGGSPRRRDDDEAVDWVRGSGVLRLWICICAIWILERSTASSVLVLTIKSVCNKLDSNFDTDSEVELLMILVNQHPDACSNLFSR
jgi:hypothetical protein